MVGSAITGVGGAWEPQKERMDAGIYIPLFLVLTADEQRSGAIYFLAAVLQTPSMFQARKPLSENAKRAGWQGFSIQCDEVRDRFVRID